MALFIIKLQLLWEKSKHFWMFLNYMATKLVLIEKLDKPH